MLHGFGIEVRQFFDGVERVIAWLIVCSELERDWQCLAVRLHSQVVCHLVVELVLVREPHRIALERKASENFLVCDVVVVCGDDILHFFNGRAVRELVLHIGGFLCSAFVGGDLNIPMNAPFVAHRIYAFYWLYIVVSLYSYHSERDLES